MTTDLALPDQKAIILAPGGLVDQWLESLDVGQDTGLAYRNGLRKFIEWLDQEQPDEVTGAAIRQWRDSQEGKPSTVNLRLSALRSFYSWAVGKGCMALDPTAGIKGLKRTGTTKRHKRDELTPEEIKAVLDTCDLNTPIGIRDRAIIALMAYCGLRTVEVYRANVGDLHTRGGRSLLWIQGKGERGKNDYAVIPALAERPLRKWLAIRPGEGDDPLFVSLANCNPGQRLSRHAIRVMVKTRYRMAGIIGDMKTTHSLRHSAISTVARHGTLFQAQALARHVDPKTTMIYYHEIDRLENPPEDLIRYGFEGK